MCFAACVAVYQMLNDCRNLWHVFDRAGYPYPQHLGLLQLCCRSVLQCVVACVAVSCSVFCSVCCIVLNMELFSLPMARVR